MSQFTTLLGIIFALIIGGVLGYYGCQLIIKRKRATIQEKLQKKLSRAQKEAELILNEAKEKANQIITEVKKEEEERKRELLKAEKLLLRRGNILAEKMADFEEKEREFSRKVKKLKEIKENLESLQQEALKNLERISKLSKEEAKKELFENLEREYQKEILEKMRKLEQQSQEELKKRAQEILAVAIQRLAISQAQEITTTTLVLPSDEIKGKIIGREGRNIRTLEKLTGVEIVIDETPEVVVISGFDPIRRQIAKTALEKLIQDGRIQPARIEEMIHRAEKEISLQIKEAGESAIYETGIIDLDPKLVQLLGRLRFRTSYGQNVLLHSIEVSHLAGALAGELKANIKVAKKAGLLHDIGKALDQEVEGSHTDIGIKILEKFGVEKEVITAMKSHHEEYPYESIEGIIVQTADAISGARPGARKDTLENYLKRLADLEKIVLSFSGVENAWILQAGKEIRVFVNPQEIDDLTAKKLAKEIANRIQEELKYPSEIKVNVIRETRITEYAK